MSMYPHPHATKVLTIGLAASLILVTAAVAGNGRDRHKHRHHRDHDRGFSSIDSRLPTQIRGIGTYVGGFSAVRDKGNGIYFYIEGSKADGPVELAPVAKIINVLDQPAGNACSWEAGVCVIRP